MSALTPRHGLIHPSENEKVKDLGLIAEQLAEQIDEKLTLRVGPNSAFKRTTNIVMWEEQAPNLSGKILLQTKIPWGDHMFRIDFKGWEYQEPGLLDLSITGYTWSGDFGIHQTNVVHKGSRPISTVEYLRNDSTGDLAIAVNAPTFWQYPKVAVDAWAGHVAMANSRFDGWTITRAGSTAGFTVKKTYNLTGSSGLGDTMWQPLSMTNGWVQYDTAFAPPRYRRKNGVVYLQGLIRGGATGAGVGILPEGFRPNYALLMSNQNDLGAGRFDVWPDGNVIHRSGGTSYFSIDCSFPIDQ